MNGKIDEYEKEEEKAIEEFRDPDIDLGAETVVAAYDSLITHSKMYKIDFKQLPIETQIAMIKEACQNIRDIKLTRKVDQRRKEYYEMKKEMARRRAEAKGKKTTRKGPTPKMVSFLVDRGYSREDVTRMTFEQAGKLIEDIRKSEGW